MGPARRRWTPSRFTPETDAARTVRADGNGVDVDQESAELAKNALEYQALVPVAGARIDDPPDRDGRALMGLFDAIDVSGSGLTAERLRMDVTAENLANAQTTQGADGQPYRRKEVVLQEAGGGSFGSMLAAPWPASARPPATACRSPASSRTRARPRRVYDPGHPDADAQGYVTLPNVNPVTEMVDLISASRAYEANVTAMQTAKTMFTKTLDLLR